MDVDGDSEALAAYILQHGIEKAAYATDCNGDVIE